MPRGGQGSLLHFPHLREGSPSLQCCLGLNSSPVEVSELPGAWEG